MSAIAIREQVINEDVLGLYELGEKSPLWEAYPQAFERMFALPNDIDEDHQETEADRLYPKPKQRLSWDWYVSERWTPAGVAKKHSTEKKLYDLLFGDSPHRLVYFHGHTGSGKSTLLRYFFTYFLPEVKQLPRSRLAKLVPLKIPLSYMTADELEREWDARVFDFLYREFPELGTEQFLRNVARHISYPIDGLERTLEMGSDGELQPEGHPPRFVKDVESRIRATLKAIDATSVVKWLAEDISVVKGLSVGKLFNRKVVQVLANHYGYEFVLIVDNIDELPSDIQTEICRLVGERMRAYAAYPRVKFIIATRDNFLEPVMSETLQVTRRFHHRLLSLPPLPFGDVLRTRKRVFFDPLRGAGAGRIKLDEWVGAQVGYVDEFIEAVIGTFDNVKKLTELYKLSNHSTRRMLDLVRAVFESPRVDRELVVRTIRAATGDGAAIRQEAGEEFVATNRIIDALVRGSNRLVALKGRIQLPNIYYAGAANHYSSTLCRPFLMAMVFSEDTISYKELEGNLSDLGHRSGVVATAAQKLLEMQIIFSAQGFRLLKGPRERARMVFEHRELPFGRYLLYDLGASLRYLQAMGYITPMSPAHRERIVVAEKVGDPVEEFRDRIGSAAALYHQIRSDMRAQIRYVEEHGERDRLERILDRYGLPDLLENIRARVTSELKRIAGTEPKLVSGLIFAKLFPKLVVEAKDELAHE